MTHVAGARRARWRDLPGCGWTVARAHSWVPDPFGLTSLPYAAVLVAVLVTMRRHVRTATSDAGARAVLVLEPPRKPARDLAWRLLALVVVAAAAVPLAVGLGRLPPAAWAVLQVSVLVLMALVAAELVPQVVRGLRDHRTQQALAETRDRDRAWLLHWVSAWPKSTGLGTPLVEAVLRELPPRTVVVLSTRTSRLASWYRRLGFFVVEHGGAGYVMSRS